LVVVGTEMLSFFAASGIPMIGFCCRSWWTRSADAASGTRSLVIEAGPQGLWANDGVVVFSLGGGKIYRILLDAM
jgi:hypothetical protein